MSENVIQNTFGGRMVAITSEPNSELVELLELALSLAREGRITAGVFCGAGFREPVGLTEFLSDSAAKTEFDAMALIGQMERQKALLIEMSLPDEILAQR